MTDIKPKIIVISSVSPQPTGAGQMETSFLSKLPEYAQFGKPILIWRPEYCSAIHWGREGDRAICKYLSKINFIFLSKFSNDFFNIVH